MGESHTAGPGRQPKDALPTDILHSLPDRGSSLPQTHTTGLVERITSHPATLTPVPPDATPASRPHISIDGGGFCVWTSWTL
jgi:hypothetical protein